MLERGLTPKQIATRRYMNISTIYDHITLLIEYGHLTASKFVGTKSYDSIISAITAVGINSPLKEIMDRCIDSVTYAELKMVIADIKRQGKEEDYIKTEDDDQDENNEWYFVDDVPYTLSSKRFLSYDCRVVLSPLGYYLEVTGDYIKLGDYPEGFSYQNPDIWIKKPKDERGYRMVHNNNGDTNLIGYLREETDLIVFTNPLGKEFTITFTDE